MPLPWTCSDGFGWHCWLPIRSTSPAEQREAAGVATGSTGRLPAALKLRKEHHSGIRRSAAAS
ncbi:hypothetical protein [Nonomuraea dietziae]|uniref:hypothetical protein n=1 Tax=Nonomuraea dietziae TaxID=65515 RepID=UPI0031DBB90D